MSEDVEKKEILKSMIKGLYEGTKPEDIKKEFKEKIKTATSEEIIEEIQEELVKEGISREASQRLWDVHLASLSKVAEQEKGKAPERNPVQFLMEEHLLILKYMKELKNLAKEIKEAEDINSVEEEMERIRQIKLGLKNTENHFLREEEVFFPYLEKHGITHPPVVMKIEHEQVRETRGVVFNLIDNSQFMAFKEFTEKLEKSVESLFEALSKHFSHEDNILFLQAINVIEKEEYKVLLEEFNKIGTHRPAPETPKIGAEEEKEEKEPPTKPEKEIASKVEKERITPFETGKLSPEEIEAIFNALHLDITFIDKDDTVQYFNQTQKRIIKRSKETIGQKIQEVFPEINIQLINSTLKDFKSGLKEPKVFWLKKEGKDICIRYFPIHNKNGEYIGCIETAQEDSKE
jgi:DUF438 domain-containing protein